MEKEMNVIDAIVKQLTEDSERAEKKLRLEIMEKYHDIIIEQFEIIEKEVRSDLIRMYYDDLYEFRNYSESNYLSGEVPEVMWRTNYLKKKLNITKSDIADVESEPYIRCTLKQLGWKRLVAVIDEVKKKEKKERRW